MPLLHVALIAALAGAAEALPVSPSGHAVAARLWLEPGPVVIPVEAFAALGAALGLAAASFRRLSGAVGEGVRAVARPSLFGASQAAHDALTLLVGSAVSLLVSGATLPRVEMWAGSPTAAGVGLCATGLGLASTQLVWKLAAHEPRRSRPGPSLPGAALVGVAHGLAVLPGASRVGAALVVLMWIGVRPSRAVELSFLLTVPSLIVAFARGVRGGVDLGVAALALSVAFLAAILAAGALRGLIERRRLAALALWTIPLGLAMLAYARALPHAF